MGRPLLTQLFVGLLNPDSKTAVRLARNSSSFHLEACGGCLKRGYLNSWMVYFMENPIKKWMIWTTDFGPVFPMLKPMGR
jgi:hypothetical protein